ncbi:hypothetical protein K402DRAFT_265921 [Aulographum hederae CBS 113979]|uniref:Uncharacterized protein n=1 Tax=Aulographum hederae CBS 113979 TaxID=1176131 RepID=A0A6G1GIN7_9PEZI|nr:hypothetical protein K402DRAFT_265921 [Aulographum hederae CBS 113979]
MAKFHIFNPATTTTRHPPSARPPPSLPYTLRVDSSVSAGLTSLGSNDTEKQNGAKKRAKQYSEHRVQRESVTSRSLAWRSGTTNACFAQLGYAFVARLQDPLCSSASSTLASLLHQLQCFRDLVPPRGLAAMISGDRKVVRWGSLVQALISSVHLLQSQRQSPNGHGQFTDYGTGMKTFIKTLNPVALPHQGRTA